MGGMIRPGLDAHLMPRRAFRSKIKQIPSKVFNRLTTAADTLCFTPACRSRDVSPIPERRQAPSSPQGQDDGEHQCNRTPSEKVSQIVRWNGPVASLHYAAMRAGRGVERRGEYGSCLANLAASLLVLRARRLLRSLREVVLVGFPSVVLASQMCLMRRRLAFRNMSG